MPNTVLGLDIGGANLKAAHSCGQARLQPFALWKDVEGLPHALRRLLQGWPDYELLAITLTGELCDCFETKRQGVLAILDAVVAAAGQIPVRVWSTSGRLLDLEAARTSPLSVAAANWLALATFAGRWASGTTGLLIDIGSTTTDIIPFSEGKPIPRGYTDSERLRSGELVYTGVRRTPLCALLGGFGAAELFATSLDVYLILGSLNEDATDRQTADGRPATRAAAEARLARMLCADLETSTPEDREKLAIRAAQRQLLLIRHALEAVASRLPAPPHTVVLAGSGEFLSRIVLQEQTVFPPCMVVSMAERISSAISDAACAYALSVLAVEQGN